MDDDGSFGIRNWAYYHQPQPVKRNLGLQLMSTVAAERDTKPLLSNGNFLHRHCGVPEPSVPIEFMRDAWIQHGRDNKLLHSLPMNHHQSSYAIMPPDMDGPHTLRMMQPADPPKEEKVAPAPAPPAGEVKKRQPGRANNPPKPKKPKKIAAPRDVAAKAMVGKKSTGLVINGIDLDISGIPTPVCSCTGTPQQCYKWGAGGWQSACCTTSMSEYPLPMSIKRRGARIAGRKMSLGAFKKVLEKLAGEGYNLSNPIDLKMFWAKHGTNKFVTIR